MAVPDRFSVDTGRKFEENWFSFRCETVGGKHLPRAGFRKARSG